MLRLLVRPVSAGDSRTCCEQFMSIWIIVLAYLCLLGRLFILFIYFYYLSIYLLFILLIIYL
jgi:hypothetical protein